MTDETSEQKPPENQKDDQQIKFEDALSRLEKIVERMESGELSLDETMTKFEEGMKLANFCTGKLNEAEKKIEVLTKEAGNENEQDQWREFPDENEGNATDEARE